MSDDPLSNPANDAASQPPAAIPDAQTAADLIRQKVARIYGAEPAIAAETAEAQAVPHRSKHQQFVYELGTSGKDLATVQTEWHDYYQKLPADEKHQVWQEFYDSQASVIHPQPLAPGTPAEAQKLAEHKHEAVHSERVKTVPPAVKSAKLRDARSTAEIQAALRDKVTAGGKLQAKHHLQSLLFGLLMGAVVVVIFLFGFFNEVFIAPFIQPSRVAAATPLIVSATSVAPTTTPEVIIPKINVEIPVDYSETSTNENTIENDLENGVVHYPTTVMPGQVGNTAFFGHSSNNIFNKGKYKFAFVLLHTLVTGDTFYLTYNDKVYVYKVISRSIVDPSDVGVLGPVAGQTATATLITCDPPGTSLHRLVVVGQQISPDPTGNIQPVTTASASSGPTTLPGNGPTLWARFEQTAVGKISIVVVLAAVFLAGVRWINQPLQISRRQQRRLRQI
jgi:LPXTG-site transpeptidase (sortase) family protein